jgi:HD-GYP domain-containing protein (c-di-GMP phosphodiesterase class II)
MVAGPSPGQSAASTIDVLHTCVALLTTVHGYRDGYTVEHEDRVAQLAVDIGTQLGLSAPRLEILRLAAIVHDIGKIAIPAEIVGKSGAFTDAEYALMKGHCLVSYNILSRLNTTWPIAEIAYQHHERLDGSGYPRGLTGGAILYEARILAVADVFDAMSSVRPYRPALPQDFVLGEMQQMAGQLLDPDAVAACRNIALYNLSPSADLPATKGQRLPMTGRPCT